MSFKNFLSTFLFVVKSFQNIIDFNQSFPSSSHTKHWQPPKHTKIRQVHPLFRSVMLLLLAPASVFSTTTTTNEMLTNLIKYYFRLERKLLYNLISLPKGNFCDRISTVVCHCAVCACMRHGDMKCNSWSTFFTVVVVSVEDKIQKKGQIATRNEANNKIKTVCVCVSHVCMCHTCKFQLGLINIGAAAYNFRYVMIINQESTFPFKFIFHSQETLLRVTNFSFGISVFRDTHTHKSLNLSFVSVSVVHIH